jgi:hypothetical protein
MKGQKKKQAWLETDLGYYKTKKALLKSGKITGDSQDCCGRLTFHLKDFKDFTVQVTTKGKVNITFPETSDYTAILNRLKPYLLNAEGKQAKLISTKILDFSGTGENKNKRAYQNENEYKTVYEHSRNLILSDEHNQRPEDWSSSLLLKQLAFWKEDQVKWKKRHDLVDAYLIVQQLLQHIQTGYPRTNSLVQDYKRLAVRYGITSSFGHLRSEVAPSKFTSKLKETNLSSSASNLPPAPTSERELDDLIDAFALEFHRIVRRVKDGRLLLGHCNECSNSK